MGRKRKLDPNCIVLQEPKPKRKFRDKSSKPKTVPSVLYGKWKLREKVTLLNAIKEHGIDANTKLYETLPSKTPTEIEELIKIYKLRAKVQQVPKSEASTPFDPWMRVVENVITSMKDESRIYAELFSQLEEQASSSDPNVIPVLPDYKLIYGFLKTILMGKPPPKLPPLESLIVLDLLRSLANLIKLCDMSIQKTFMASQHPHLVTDPINTAVNKNDNAILDILHFGHVSSNSISCSSKPTNGNIVISPINNISHNILSFPNSSQILQNKVSSPVIKPSVITAFSKPTSVSQISLPINPVTHNAQTPIEVSKATQIQTPVNPSISSQVSPNTSQISQTKSSLLAVNLDSLGSSKSVLAVNQIKSSVNPLSHNTQAPLKVLQKSNSSEMSHLQKLVTQIKPSVNSDPHSSQTSHKASVKNASVTPSSKLVSVTPTQPSGNCDSSINQIPCKVSQKSQIESCSSTVNPVIPATSKLLPVSQIKSPVSCDSNNTQSSSKASQLAQIKSSSKSASDSIQASTVSQGAMSNSITQAVNSIKKSTNLTIKTNIKSSSSAQNILNIPEPDNEKDKDPKKKFSKVYVTMLTTKPEKIPPKAVLLKVKMVHNSSGKVDIILPEKNSFPKDAMKVIKNVVNQPGIVMNKPVAAIMPINKLKCLEQSSILEKHEPLSSTATASVDNKEPTGLSDNLRPCSAGKDQDSTDNSISKFQNELEGSSQDLIADSVNKHQAAIENTFYKNKTEQESSTEVPSVDSPNKNKKKQVIENVIEKHQEESEGILKDPIENSFSKHHKESETSLQSVEDSLNKNQKEHESPSQDPTTANYACQFQKELEDSSQVLNENLLESQKQLNSSSQVFCSKSINKFQEKPKDPVQDPTASTTRKCPENNDDSHEHKKGHEKSFHDITAGHKDVPIAQETHNKNVILINQSDVSFSKDTCQIAIPPVNNSSLNAKKNLPDSLEKEFSTEKLSESNQVSKTFNKPQTLPVMPHHSQTCSERSEQLIKQATKSGQLQIESKQLKNPSSTTLDDLPLSTSKANLTSATNHANLFSSVSNPPNLSEILIDTNQLIELQGGYQLPFSQFTNSSSQNDCTLAFQLYTLNPLGVLTSILIPRYNV